MTWVKICGTTNLADARMSVEAGADALGFIFAPSARRISVADAAEIVSAVGTQVETVGIFVNEAPKGIAEVVKQVGLSAVQLHGDEPVEQWAKFRRAIGKRKVVKALSASSLQSAEEPVEDVVSQAFGEVDAILLDSGSAEKRGGTGIPFDWEKALPLASAIRNKLPLIIAGGLNAENVGKAIELFEPWGVDVVSGVECEPGRKEMTRLRKFVSAVRQHVTK